PRHGLRRSCARPEDGPHRAVPPHGIRSGRGAHPEPRRRHAPSGPLPAVPGGFPLVVERGAAHCAHSVPRPGTPCPAAAGVSGLRARCRARAVLPVVAPGTPRVCIRSTLPPLTRKSEHMMTPAVPSAGEAWIQHEIRRTAFEHAFGGPIDTGGVAAVALRCDHGLANFARHVLPLTIERRMTVSQAHTPRNWHLEENAGVTAEEMNDWVHEGHVEVWNHSASHRGISTEEDIHDE